MLDGQRGMLASDLATAPDFVCQGVHPCLGAAAAVIGGNDGKRFEPTIGKIAVDPGNFPSTRLGR